MKPGIATMISVSLAAVAGGAFAQQPAAPAPPPPAFAAPDLSPSGVRSMAAACTICHGTNGRAVEGSAVASLAGRPAADLVGLMNQFKSGSRPATIMTQIAKGYGDTEIAAISDYFSKQR
jgi:cytochrome subunit of sulfide dehydrogenase